MPKRPSHSHSGFSLIEILISIAVIGVMVVIYQLVISDNLLVRLSKDQEIALRVANNKMEELRAGGYSALPATSTFTDTQLTGLPAGSGSLTVTTVNTKTKQVVVTISWNEPGIPTTQTISVATLITSIGGL